MDLNTEEQARYNPTEFLRYGSDDACESTCKYCGVHKYGVFILDFCWLGLMLLTLYAYRAELSAFARGQLKYTEPFSYGQSIIGPAQSSLERRPEVHANPMPSKSEGGGFSVDAVGPSSELASPGKDPFAFKVTLTIPKDVLTKGSPANKVTKTPVTQATPNGAETKPTQDPKEDPFRLPKAKKPVIKSTGSGYFEQVMQGKKPVASISQYMQLQDEKKSRRNKKEGRGKKHKKRNRDKRKAGQSENK